MGFIPVELDKSRNFKYGMKALDLIESKFKKPVSKVDFGGLTMRETAVVMWAGLVHEDNKLTPDRVMEMVDQYSNLKKVSAIMGEAINDAFGDEDEEKND